MEFVFVNTNVNQKQPPVIQKARTDSDIREEGTLEKFLYLIKGG
jgi:hypothetical protein